MREPEARRGAVGTHGTGLEILTAQAHVQYERDCESEYVPVELTQLRSHMW